VNAGCPFMLRSSTSPAQGAGLDEVGVTGPHRIAIDPLRADLGTSSPLNRLVNADHQRPSRYKRRDQQTEQDATDGQARPDGTTEDPVVRPEGGEVLQAQHPQDRGDHALTGRENGAHQEYLHTMPDRSREDGSKWSQNGHTVGRQSDLFCLPSSCQMAKV